jgi:hypothetical protein
MSRQSKRVAALTAIAAGVMAIWIGIGRGRGDGRSPAAAMPRSVQPATGERDRPPEVPITPGEVRPSPVGVDPPPGSVPSAVPPAALPSLPARRVRSSAARRTSVQQELWERWARDTLPELVAEQHVAAVAQIFDDFCADLQIRIEASTEGPRVDGEDPYLEMFFDALRDLHDRIGPYVEPALLGSAAWREATGSFLDACRPPDMTDDP